MQAMQDSISNLGQQLASTFGGPSMQQAAPAQQTQLQQQSQFTQVSNSSWQHSSQLRDQTSGYSTQDD
jgi:hypothetical protein